MEYKGNSNKFNNDNSILYPQAKNPESKICNYSNTNSYNYSKMSLNSRTVENEDSTFDSIAKEISNNITLNFNSRIEKANKLNEAIMMIKDAITDEAEDEAFYNVILNQTMDNEDKKIISDIANDEKKHNMILKQIYFSLTGANITMKDKNNMNNVKANTYIGNLKKAFFGELDAIKKYRKILCEMTDKENYNKIMEIMVDEITHADKLNYLISKNMINPKREDNNK